MTRGNWLSPGIAVAPTIRWAESRRTTDDCFWIDSDLFCEDVRMEGQELPTGRGGLR